MSSRFRELRSKLTLRLMTTMLKRLAGCALMAALCVALPMMASAQDKPVTAANGWVKLPADGATSTEAFASVSNPGMYAIYLLSATSDVAGKVELRDAKKGTQALEEVAVLQYETTYMDPKGVHMVLSGLKRPLKEGETIWITMKTDTQEEVQVEAVVKKE